MARHSILIIDDDYDLLEMLKLSLQSHGFEVAGAMDGLQGILQAHKIKPNLILLDFRMPAGGGGVYDKLRASPVTAKTPIVFLSASSVKEIRDKIHLLPNTYFLSKPIAIPQLYLMVDNVLGSPPPTNQSHPEERDA